MIALLLLSLTGCGSKHVFRSTEVYEAELAWNAAAFEQAGNGLVEQGIEEAAEGDLARCSELVELGRLLLVRGPYHAEASRYAAGLSPDDPGDPPPVPPATDVCITTLQEP